MKKHKQGKSIITLLSKYYLAFTAMLFLLGAGAFCAWTLYLSNLLRSPDVAGMLNTQAFRQGRYQAVDAARFLGRTGGFAVLDQEGKAIYSSSSLIPQMENLQDLYCVPEYIDPDATIESLSFLTEEGKRRLLLTQDIWTEEGFLETKVALLDEHNRVLEGSLLPGVKEYTPRQIGYLSGSWSDDYRLARWTLEEPEDNAATVLLLLPQYSDAYYQQVLQQAGRLWLLVIPIYFGATLIFVTLLNRHFRLPLTRLNTAISRLGAGERVSAGDCGGPKELERLGQSFDEMANKLAQSEEQARRLQQQRITMLTDISHDLKTPITVISGYANAIRDGKVPQEELSQYLQTIGNKADVLTELINSFHEYSKTQHPDFRLTTKETDLCEFLREYLADKFNEIDLAGFSLEVDIPEQPMYYLLDGFQMRRALDNILANALKHNRLGTRIWVVVERAAMGVTLRIADNGDGIPEHFAKGCVHALCSRGHLPVERRQRPGPFHIPENHSGPWLVNPAGRGTDAPRGNGI